MQRMQWMQLMQWMPHVQGGQAEQVDMGNDDNDGLDLEHVGTAKQSPFLFSLLYSKMDAAVRKGLFALSSYLVYHHNVHKLSIMKGWRSPLATHTFEKYGLKPFINKGIEALRFTEPTPIQRNMIPLILKGESAIGQSHFPLLK
jgi:hypothetical protein